MTENTITDEKLAKMLAKVQGLLAVAEDSATEPKAAENYRAQAQTIMTKYRIEEEELRQTKIASGTAAKPVKVEFSFLQGFGPYTNHYYSMMLNVMDHVGVRGKYRSTRVHNEETGRTESEYIMTMIGFDSDVAVAQMLYTNLRLTFSEKLEPKLDPTLSDSENVYRLRSAGVERDRISKMLWPDASLRGPKVTKLYAEACAARGEDPKVVGRSVNAKTFRASYADAFVAETRNRLRRMRTMEAQEAGVIVLAGREEAVNEAFYEAYPELRPAAYLPGKSEYKPCEKCAKAKSGSCRAHTYRAAKPAPFSNVGWSAGTNAAREADLSRAAASPTPRLGG
jgi:hypothetical protein